MIFLYTLSLAASIWCIEANQGSPFWIAWGIAWGFVNCVLILREVAG